MAGNRDPLVVIRTRLAVTALQKFGLCEGTDPDDDESLNKAIRNCELGDFSSDELVDLPDAEFDQLLLSDDPGTVHCLQDHHPGPGDLEQLISGCAQMAGTAMPARNITEFTPDRGSGVEWQTFGTNHTLVVDGKYWTPTPEINRSVQGPRRFYTGPIDINWCLFWLTDTECHELTERRGWTLFG